MADRAGSLTVPAERRSGAPGGGEWLALIVALGIAHALFARTIAFPSAYDATNYLDIARDIERNGLFSKFHYSQLRTYGYPLLLRAMRPLAEALQLPWTFVVFEAQLAAHVAATLFLRRRLLDLSPTLAGAATIALLANPIPLVYVADTLSESVSLTLVIVAAGCVASLFAARRSSVVAILVGSLAVGFAIAVRPANLFALPAWLLAVGVAGWLRGWPARRLAGCLALVVVSVALPLVPQTVNNVRHYDRFTPLVASELGRLQQVWGIANLKYATALPPIELPSIFYVNPFAAERPVDESRPLAWYAEHPAAGLATLALHVFGMLDQDLLFTYARDLDPWYRRPLAVAVQASVALSVLALVALGRRARRDRMHRAAFVVLIALIASHVGLHATTAVEMRFGLPLLALAGVLAVGFLQSTWPGLATRRRVASLAVVVAWLVASMPLSDWMREQSPQIRAWQARAAAQDVP